jgi:hypothetical protein
MHHRKKDSYTTDVDAVAREFTIRKRREFNCEVLRGWKCMS